MSIKTLPPCSVGFSPSRPAKKKGDFYLPAAVLASSTALTVLVIPAINVVLNEDRRSSNETVEPLEPSSINLSRSSPQIPEIYDGDSHELLFLENLILRFRRGGSKHDESIEEGRLQHRYRD